MGGLLDDHYLVLPRLHELCFYEQRHNGAGQPTWHTPNTDYIRFSTWTTPNLRVVRCTQYIPPPTFPFKFESFSLSLTLLPNNIPNQLRDFLQFLGGAPRSCIRRGRVFRNIVLELDIFDVADIKLGGELSVASTILPSLKSFRLGLSNSNFPQGSALAPHTISEDTEKCPTSNISLYPST